MALHFRYRHLNKPIWIQAELSLTTNIKKEMVTLSSWVGIHDKYQVSWFMLLHSVYTLKKALVNYMGNSIGHGVTYGYRKLPR